LEKQLEEITKEHEAKIEEAVKEKIEMQDR